MRIATMILSSCLLISPAAATRITPPQPPAISDFSHIVALETGMQAPGYDLQLPRQVYPKSETTNLKDLRVFNGAHEILPMRISDPGDVTKIQQGHINMPVFQLSEGRWVSHRDTVVSTSSEQSGPDTVSNRHSQLLSYRSRQDVTSNNEYILDAATVGDAWITTLELDYQHSTPGNFVFSVSVEGTRDFSRWHRIAAGQRLLDFNSGEVRIINKRVSLGATGFPFYRIRFNSSANPPQLKAVVAQTRASETVVSTVYESAATGIRAEDDAGYHFQNPDGLRIERLTIGVPAENTLARFTVHSRPTTAHAWIRRSSGLLYRMTISGERFDNDPFSVEQTNDHFWRLTVDDSSGGLGGGLPSIALGWVPHRLQFLARGSAPFVLAIGNPMLNRSAPGQWYNDAITTGLAHAFKRIESHSPVTENPHYQPYTPPRATDYQRYLLWALLLAMVGTMIFFSLKLIKSNEL